MVKAKLSKRLKGQGGEMELNVDISIENGAFVALYGKSGAGKTSILRMIAGLMKPDQGMLQVEGEQWTSISSGFNLKPKKRPVGFVFQDYALFPNMTVLENLTYALGKHQSSSTIDSLIEMMELGDLRHSKPPRLSGGQQQRVALARAIVPRPKLLLMDEPLSALDWEIRQKLQGYIKLVHTEYNLTSIMVSHDLSEVVRLSDYVYVLEGGKVIKEGTPQQTLVCLDDTSSAFERIGEVISIDTEAITVMIDNVLYTISSNCYADIQLTVGDMIYLAPASSKMVLRRMP